MFKKNNFHTDQIQQKYFYMKVILCVVGINCNRTTNAFLSLLGWLLQQIEDGVFWLAQLTIEYFPRKKCNA